MSARQKWTSVYLFVLLFVFPLFTGLHGYAQITAAKFYFLLIVTVLWAVLMLVLTLRAIDRRGGCPTLWPTEIAVLAFSAVCAVSALASPFFPESLLGAGRWDGLVTILLYVAIFFGARRFGRLRAEHLYAAGAAILIQFAIAFAQLLDGNPLHLFPGDLRFSDAGIRYSGVFLGTIGNVDLLSAYLCLFIPLLTGAYLLNERRWPLLIPSALGILLLLYSGVAAGPVSLALASLVALPFLLDRRDRLTRFFIALAAFLLSASIYAAVGFQHGAIAFRAAPAAGVLLLSALLCTAGAATLNFRHDRADKSRKAYLRAVLCAEALLLAAALAVLWFWPGTSGTLYELHSVLHGRMSESFGSSRIRIWRETLALVAERPLLGGGPGTLALRLQIDFERFVPETGQTLRSFVDNAHNVYLGYLADTGILGLLAYLSIVVCTAAELLRRRHGQFRPAIGFALLGGWFADLFGLGLCLTAPLLWLLWGLSGVTKRRDAPKGS